MTDKTAEPIVIVMSARLMEPEYAKRPFKMMDGVGTSKRLKFFDGRQEEEEVRFIFDCMKGTEEELVEQFRTLLHESIKARKRVEEEKCVSSLASRC